MPDENGDRTTNEWMRHIDNRLTAAIDQKADKEAVTEIAQDVKAVKGRVNWLMGVGTAAWVGVTTFFGLDK